MTTEVDRMESDESSKSRKVDQYQEVETEKVERVGLVPSVVRACCHQRCRRRTNLSVPPSVACPLNWTISPNRSTPAQWLLIRLRLHLMCGTQMEEAKREAVIVYIKRQRTRYLDGGESNDTRLPKIFKISTMKRLL